MQEKSNTMFFLDLGDHNSPQFPLSINYIWLDLVRVYGISTLVGYLIPNPVHIYIYIYIYTYYIYIYMICR